MTQITIGQRIFFPSNLHILREVDLIRKMSVWKIIFCICLMFVAVINAASISLIAKYKDSCDKLDIDSILKNPALINSYVNCLLNKGPCTKYGKEIRSAIPEILSTTCADCSANQRRIVQRVMNYMYSNKQPEFDTLFDLYDPEKKYRASMMNFMIHADHVSDLQSKSSTSHKPSSRHSPRSILHTTHGSSSITEPSNITPRKLHTRYVRISSTSPEPTTDFHSSHRTHRTHSSRLTGSSSTESL